MTDSIQRRLIVSRLLQKLCEGCPIAAESWLRYLSATQLFDSVEALPVAAAAAWQQQLGPTEHVYLCKATHGNEHLLLASYQLMWRSAQEQQQFQMEAEANGALVGWTPDGAMIEVALGFLADSISMPVGESAFSGAVKGSISYAEHSTHACHNDSSNDSSSDSSSVSHSGVLHEELIQRVCDLWKLALNTDNAQQGNATLLSQPCQQSKVWEQPVPIKWGVSSAFRSLFPFRPPQTPRRDAVRLSEHLQPTVPALTRSVPVTYYFTEPIADIMQYIKFRAPLQQDMALLLERVRRKVIIAVERQLPNQLRHRVRRWLSANQRRAEAAAVCMLAYMVMLDAPETVGTNARRLKPDG